MIMTAKQHGNNTKSWNLGVVSLLLLLLSSSLIMIVSATKVEKKMRLRHNGDDHTLSSYTEESITNPRVSVVERIYGSQSTVRQAIRTLEERMVRYQTGIAPDVSHIVPYINHPYERNNEQQQQRHRRMQTNTTTDDRFAPIRMHFETIALDQRRDLAPDNAAKIQCTLCACVGFLGGFCPLYLLILS
jgi:hypothetical protein